MTLNQTGSNDTTINKVAVCSAIFAGFAYIGYSVAKNAFDRRVGRKKDDAYFHENRQLYFRRLSQTTQTDVLLGNLDTSNSSRVFLRPMTVQQRIKELNLRSRMFADTLIAIQTPNKHCLGDPKSLQASPWNSPRIMSPVDASHLLGSCSTENFRIYDNFSIETNFGTPLRRKGSNNPLKLKSAQSSEQKLSLNYSNENMEEFKKINESSLNRPLEFDEAKKLLKLLGSKDYQVLEKAILTVVNLATFTSNQELMREIGYLSQLQSLIYHSEESIQINALKSLGNLALNINNSNELKEIIPNILALMKITNSDEIIYNCLSTLTNISVFHTWHCELKTSINTLYCLLESTNTKIVLQCLKLLINLSCNTDMMPFILDGKAPKVLLLSMFDLDVNEDILLRILTLFNNITETVKSMEKTLDFLKERVASSETMYGFIYETHIENIRTKMLILIKQHPNEEIQYRSQKMYNSLNN